MLFSFLESLEFIAKIVTVFAYIGLLSLIAGIGFCGYKLIQWIF